MVDGLSLQRIVLDGLLLVSVIGVILVGSAYYNARLWLQDFPKAVRAKVAPNTPQEKREQIALMVLFLGSIIGVLYYSNAQLKSANGGVISFGTAWLNTFILFNIGNLFDAVVLDWLVLTVMKPRFMLLPGTTIADYAEFDDWRWHVGNYVKGVVIGAVFSLPIAFVATL
jgi:hypothetical protein